LALFALMTKGSLCGKCFNFKSASVKVTGMCDYGVLKCLTSHT
jgi:hypothetical protein